MIVWMAAMSVAHADAVCGTNSGACTHGETCNGQVATCCANGNHYTYGTTAGDVIVMNGTFTLLWVPTAYGYAGDDTICGSDSLLGDLILGGDGLDWIDGQDGGDLLYGGERGDVIYGGPGGDVINGGNGPDELYGEDGADYLDGGDHNDVLYGGGDADTLRGMLGDDELWGELGTDELYGGPGFDDLYGGEDGDELCGGQDTDYLSGSAGDDVVCGGTGALDQLYGGDGDDDLNGSTCAGPGPDADGAFDAYYAGADVDTCYASPTDANEFPLWAGAGCEVQVDANTQANVWQGAYACE